MYVHLYVQEKTQYIQSSVLFEVSGNHWSSWRVQPADKGGLLYDIFFLKTTLLEYNCFTMLCQFLLQHKKNQLYVYIYPHIPSLLHLPPTLHIPPLYVITKHQADLPVLGNYFPLAIYFTFASVYMSVLLSDFVPAYPSPSPCPQVHSLHLHLYSCPAPRFITTILFFQIPYICVSIWYLFFSF